MWLFGVLVYVTVTSQDVIADPNSDWSDEEMLSNQEESIQLWTSDNVVAENLKAARGLDTTYYVTSSDQSSDFFWDRESGLRVNIGVNKVDLSATFYGVKPESDDNDFVLEAPKSPVTEAEKERFRNEVTTFCRHPVPDYHKVTMEMFKDRTTRAEYISCDSSGSEEDSRCRGEFTFPNLTSSSSSATSFQRTGRGMNNDRRIIAQHEKEKHHNLVYRHLNEPCVKMGTFPRQIEKATNGIACHRRADKLSPMFGLVRDDLDHHITFAPKHCKEASVTCDLCLADAKKRCHDNTTRGNGDSTSNCCYLDCWNSPPCIHSKSSRCTEGKVECSSGQVNLYTLEPVFSKERTDCHVISASDDDQLPVAYELFFFLQFQSPSSSTWHSGIFPDSNDQSLNVGEKMGRRLIKRTYVHPLNPPNGDFDHKNGDHHRNNNSSSSKQPSLFYQSKTFHKKILPRDIQTWASSKSRVAFLTVQHETGLKLSKEMIITKIEQDGSWKHFIEALDGPDDDVKKKNIESKDSSPEIKRRAPHKVVDKRAQDDEDDDERDNDSREDYELSTNLSADEEMIKRGHSTSYDDEAGYDDYNVGGDGNDITEKKIHSHVLTIDGASRKQDGLHRRQHGASKLPDVTPSRKTGSHKQPPQQQQQQQQQNKNNYFHVQQVLPNSYTLLAKLIRPFIYSSASWGKGNRCSNKEPKWFKPYRPATRRLQEVNLDVDVNDDRFKYSVRSSNGAPYIRFTIPANQSILGDFFPPSSNFRIIRDGRKLKMKVVQGHDLKWRIHIFGETSGCPCYIKLEMFEGSKTSPLLLYDLLVLCPSKFTVIMTLPGGVVPFLSIKLIDSITTHSFFVTFDQKHQFPNSNRSDAPTSSASLATDATGAVTKPTATASSLSMFCILSIVASCLLMLRVILTPLWFGILHGEVCYLTDETTAFRCHNLSGQSINSSSFPLLEFQTSSTCSVLPKYKQSKSSKDSPASPITSSLSSGSSSSPKLLPQNVNRPSKPRSDPSHFHRRCCCSQHETTTTTTATTTTTTTATATTTSTTFQKLIDKKESFEMNRSKMKDIVNLYFVVLVIYSLLTTFSASFFIFQTLAATRVSHGNPSGSKVDTRNDSSQVVPDDAWRDSSRMESLLSDCNSKFLDFIRILHTRSESHFANPAKGRNFGTSGFFRSGKIGSINQPTSAVVENSTCRILPTLCLVRGKVEGLKNELMEKALDTLRNISKRGTNSTIRENRWLDIFKHLSDNAVDFDTEVDDDGGKHVVEKGLLGILKFPEFKDGYDVLRLGMIKNASLFRLFISKKRAGEEFHDFMENFGKRISSKMASSESHHLLTSFEDSQGCRSQCGRCGGCGCCGRVRCGDVDPGGASYCPSLSSIRFFVGSSEESTAFGSQISSIDDDGDEDGRIGNDARMKLIQNHYDDDSIWKGMMPSQSSPPLSSSSSSSLTSSSSQEFSDLKNVLRLAFFVLDLFLTLYRVTESYKKCLGLFSCPSMRCCSLGGPTMNCRREATSTTQMLPSSADVNCQADQRHVDGDVTKRDDDDDDDDGDDVGGSGNNDVTRTNNSSRVERKRPPEVNTPKTLKAEKSPYFSSCFSGVSSLNRSAPLEHPVAKGRGQATPGSVRRKRRLKYFFFRFRFFALALCSMYRTSFPRSLVAFLVLSFTSLIVFVIDSSSCPSDVMRIMNVLYTNDTLVYKTRRDNLEIQPEVQDISRLQSYLFDKTLFRELNSMVDLFRAGHNRSNTEEDKNKNEENLADDDDDDGDDDDDEDGDDEDDDDDEKDLLAPLLSCAGETYTSEKAYEYDEEEHGSTVLSEGTSEDEGSREEILFAMLATSRAIVVFIIITFLVHLLCMATEVGIKMALFWRYESYHWRLIQHFSSQPSFSTVGTCSENTANMFSPGCSCFLCHEMTTHNIGCHVKKIDIDRCIAKLSHHHHQHHSHHHHHYHIFTDSCYLSLPNERHLKPRDQTIPSFASTAADDIAHRTQLYCPPMNRGSVVSYLETKV